MFRDFSQQPSTRNAVDFIKRCSDALEVDLAFKAYNVLVSSQSPNIFVLGALAQCCRVCKKQDKMQWIEEELQKFSLQPSAPFIAIILNYAAENKDHSIAMHVFDKIQRRVAIIAHKN